MRTCGEELGARSAKPGRGDRCVDALLLRDVIERYRDAKVPRAVLEVRCAIESPVRLDLACRPDVELAFLVLAVGVEARTERTFGRSHFRQRPRHDVARGVGKQRVARCTPGVRIQRQQGGVVVEHFLEVRDRPFGIDAVAADAAGELVMDAAFRHSGKRHAHDLERPRVVRRSISTQAEIEIGRVRKLGRLAKAAMHRVERSRQGGGRAFPYYFSIEQPIRTRRKKFWNSPAGATFAG